MAMGWVEFSPAASPFDLAVTRDGRAVYDLTITVSDLPVPSSLGSYSHFEGWLATLKLDAMRDLGPVQNGSPLAHPRRLEQVSWCSYLRKRPRPAEVGAGPIVLVGRSPSSLSVQSLAGHPFYNTGQPPD